MKIDLKNCTLFIRRTSGANTAPSEGSVGDFALVRFGEGDFTFDSKTPFQYELDRGRIDDVRPGDEEPMEVSFTGKFETVGYYASLPTYAGSNPLIPIYRNQLSILEAIKGKMADGSAHPWLAAGIEREPWSGCSPYCVTLELHNDPRHECPDRTPPGEAYLFRYFRAESRNCDVKGGTIQVQGKCNMLRPHILNPLARNSDPAWSVSTNSPLWLYENGEYPYGGGDQLDVEAPIPFLSDMATGWPSATLSQSASGAWPLHPKAAKMIPGYTHS